MWFSETLTDQSLEASTPLSLSVIQEQLVRLVCVILKQKQDFHVFHTNLSNIDAISS